VPETITPSTFAEAAAALGGAAASPRPVRFSGSGTKLGWGGSPPRQALRIQTAGLARKVEHNAGDLSATFEAGASLSWIQSELAASGQMLALDPPIGADDRSPTLGGIFATADSGPLRHRYGAPRDLVLGMTIALSDGTIARTGGKVMKNVAGYDLARLLTGSFGTLGLILSVSVRLHPLLAGTVTALGASNDPGVLRDCVVRISREPLDLESLDIAWRGGQGGILARVGGLDAAERAERVIAIMLACGLRATEVRANDEPLWARQRTGQRSTDRAVVQVSARPSELDQVLRIAESCEGTVVGRGGLGISYVTVNVNRVVPLRSGLPQGSSAIVLDLPVSARGAVDPWAAQEDGPELALMRAVKHRFDPAGVCNPGIFVGGI
jgi:glycolate oxidase FAD binding subunit